MRRVLLATPIRNGTDSNYIRSLFNALRTPIPGIELDFQVVGNTYVNFARNSLACYAIDHGFDEVLWVDDDILYTPANIERILSHPQDIVGGIYCKRKGGEPEWLFVPKASAEPRTDGLLECTGVATGFLRTSVKALTTIRDRFPERRYYWIGNDALRDSKRSGLAAPKETRFEFFPMGVIGPGTPEGRLEKIKYHLADESISANELLLRIREAALSVQEPGMIRGEDYYFCRIARQAGLQVFVDIGMQPLGHIGDIAFPITPDKVGWRTDGQNEFKIPAGEM